MSEPTTIRAESGPPDAALRLADRLACPACRSGLEAGPTSFRCTACETTYPVREGILDLRAAGVERKDEAIDWSKHWAPETQQGLAQRFFSTWRKEVFARAVRHFVGRWLPADGVLVEAGSGTSETSMRIRKSAAGPLLVAADIDLPVLGRCHPVMDVRVCGDIFALPFKDGSLDGIWNVGVMEHFTDDRIDAILREFRRVLAPGRRVVLLWPAIFSVPQRLLRVVEWFINLRRSGERFHFHPDEISQLRSVRHGRDVLSRNGFRLLHADIGQRTMMSFLTLVGETAAVPQTGEAA